MEELRRVEEALRRQELATEAAERELETARSRARAERGRLSSLTRRRAALQQRATAPVLTEHALVRYLERIRGIDVEAVRQAIVTPELVRQVETCGDGLYPGPGCRVKVVDRMIVTVLPPSCEKGR
jgi:hypothetical protein